MIAIAIMSNPKKLSSKLTLWATGSAAYHIAFVDLEGNRMFDQNLLFRRRIWPHYEPETVKLYKCPVEITREQLEFELDTSTDVYGVFDYMAFFFKKLFKWQAPSFKGSICSEKVSQILWDHGWAPPWGENTPSPADFEKVLEPM